MNFRRHIVKSLLFIDPVHDAHAQHNTIQMHNHIEGISLNGATCTACSLFKALNEVNEQ